MKTITALVLIVAFGVAASAQYAPGDTLLVDAVQNRPLLGVTPQGAYYTVAGSLAVAGRSIMPSPDNRSMWVSGNTSTGQMTVSIAPDGTITSINNGLNLGSRAMDVDDTGAAILSNLAGPQLLRYQQSQLTTVFNGPPLQTVFAGCIDTASGEFVLLQSTNILRARLDSGAVLVTTAIGAALQTGNGGAHFDPDNQSILVARRDALMELTLGSPSVLRTITTPFAFGIGHFDRDPVGQDFVIPTLAAIPQLYRYDGRSRTVTTIVPLPAGGTPVAAAIASSRHLVATAAATPGSSFPMLVSSPRDAGDSYVTAISFSMTTGFPLPGGYRLFLAPDLLFQLSLTNAGIFRNFQGTLDARGEGFPILDVPNDAGLSGARFYAAVATFDAQGLRLVSEPIGVTIR